jgi:hypothetical protein
MLLPDDVGGRTPLDLADVEMLDTGTIDGVRCYRLFGRRSMPNDEAAIVTSSAGLSSTVWIEEETFLLRRVESGLGGGSVSAETVVDVSPQLGPVSEDSLRLVPTALDAN